MKKLGALLVLLLLAFMYAAPASAQSWYVGKQPITYTAPHILGDGSMPHGGEAPYYANEPADTPTPAALASAWTRTCAIGDIGTNPGDHCGEFHNAANGGAEAKARFDCNDTAEESSDPIVKPGEEGTNPHRHEFFGNTAAAGNMELVDYDYLRTHGYASCYGGPMNRTLYWHPTLYVMKGTLALPLKARNVVTYYTCIGTISKTDTDRCTRWPRHFAEIAGFDTSDPTNKRITDKLNNVGGTFTDSPGQYGTGGGNGFSGWSCVAFHTPSYTAYAPNQKQGAAQPYLNDGAGHNTLDCQTAAELVANGYFSQIPQGGTANSILVQAIVDFPGCWDGVNPQSPNGRDHVQQAVSDSRYSALGNRICPDHWYQIPSFSAHIQYMFQDNTEMSTAYLSCDRMPGMTQFKGAECMHADVFPAWDYGTGDNPGFMIKFFVHCDGITVHLKNSDGVTYTDLQGDPHECGYGRVDETTQTVVDAVPPECALAAPAPCPSLVVNTNPDQSSPTRYFDLPNGTPLPSQPLHQQGSSTGGMAMNAPANDNTPIAGAAPVSFDLSAVR